MSMQRRSRKSDDGFGAILILVLAIIFVVAAGAMAQGTFSRTVLRGTAKTLVNQQMQMLGEDILTEAKYFISRAINSKDLAGGLYFRQFRRRTGKFDSSASLAELPISQKKAVELRDYEVIGHKVSLSVLKQSPTSHENPTEHSRCGLLEMAVKIEHKPSGFSRQLKLCHEFTVSLTSVPRPLDRTTLFVKEGDKLVDGSGYTANSLIEESNSILEDVVTALERFIEGYDDAIEKAQSSGVLSDQVLQMLIATRQLCVECRGKVKGPIRITRSPSEAEGKSVLLYPSHSYSLVSFDEEVDLELLALPDRVRKGREDLNEAQQSERKALAALEEYADEKPNPPTRLYELQKRWCLNAEEVSALAMSIIEQFRSFQQVIRPLSFKTMNSLDDTVNSFSVRDWRSRSTLAVESVEDMERHLSGDKGCSGVFFLSNRKKWVVDRVFRGRTVIVLTGDCQLNRCLVQDPKRDTVTLICFGELKVDGPVEGSIVAWNRATMTSRSVIKGTLLVKDPWQSGRPTLAGNINRDERLISGPSHSNGLVSTVDTNHQYVNIVPYSLATSCIR